MGDWVQGQHIFMGEARMATKFNMPGENTAAFRFTGREMGSETGLYHYGADDNHPTEPGCQASVGWFSKKARRQK